MLTKYIRLIATRSFKEQLLLTISVIGMLGIGAIIPVRILEQHWPMVMLDSTLVLLFALFTYLVWHQRFLNPLSYLIATVILVGTTATAFLQGYPQVFWLFPAITAVFVILSARDALIGITITFVVMAFPLSDNMTPSELITYFLTLVTTSIFMFLFSRQLLSQHEKLERLAHLDPLTEIGNRRAFEQQAKTQMAMYQRSETPLSLIIFDIDDFKDVNDRLGHEEGDRVLLAVTQAIGQRLRKSDSLFRLGGEEFGVLLHNTVAEDALNLGQYLQMALAGLNHHDCEITASFGVAEYQGEGLSRWMSRTDKAMYTAKNNGKNQVALADPDPTSKR
ncbi:Phytochrome-like protein cph2 [Saliniradius amylolyticus]|uniref:diguanylate cyclase n=1 Tax=Saliniradius amylolyticus TaxID=2183582 RepID=A0A2S2E1N5_9ALTE|nr:GGDEF domain-containing protein [Saliniradius amylolyticus]AWL11561.1 Phytochrome-like protein cph2 [Saliniradius amylolyticus]